MNTKYIVGGLGLLTLLGVGVYVATRKDESNGITITPGPVNPPGNPPGANWTPVPGGIPHNVPTFHIPPNSHIVTNNTNTNIGCGFNPNPNLIM